MKKGLFITFEGIDGCGKTTQVRRLAKHILELNKYNHVLITREPYKNKNIRKILQEDSDPYSQAKKLAYLYTEDRKLHVKELIFDAIKKNLFVISDRYSFSTLAYQQTQRVPLAELLGMHKGLPIPDIVFLIDIPAETAMDRMKKDHQRIKGKENKFETNLEFIKKLRENYLKLVELANHNVVIIDGTKSVEQIFEKQIKPAFNKFISLHR